MRRSHMNLELGDKVAIVFGGGGGLGGAIAKSMVDEGARVVVADIDEDAAVRTVDSIGARGNAFGLGWDISNLSIIQKQIQIIERKFGPVDILVNNTGGPPPTTASGQSA